QANLVGTGHTNRELERAALQARAPGPCSSIRVAPGLTACLTFSAGSFMEGSLTDRDAPGCVDSGSRSLVDQCMGCFSREGITLQSSPRKFADWVEKGRNGDFMFVVSTACPAYHYEHLPGAEPRYTYTGLGADIGLAGKRLFRSLDAFRRLLKEGLRIRRFQH